jgi:hypothetical protein
LKVSNPVWASKSASSMRSFRAHGGIPAAQGACKIGLIGDLALLMRGQVEIGAAAAASGPLR